MREDVLARRPRSALNTSPAPDIPAVVDNVKDGGGGQRQRRRRRRRPAWPSFASMSVERNAGPDKVSPGVPPVDGESPSPDQFLKHPLALLSLVPKDAALFASGAIAGAAAKSLNAPLDRVKILMQTHGLRAVEEDEKRGIGFIEFGFSWCLLFTAMAMIGKEEGIKGYWKGNLPQKSLPEKYQKRPESSLATAILSATLATLMCYPLDTVRRQMQMKDSPYKSVLDAFPGIVEQDGLVGLYRGFVPNALKNLPNSSIKLTTFDTVKGLIAAGQKEFQKIVEENRAKIDNP